MKTSLQFVFGDSSVDYTSNFWHATDARIMQQRMHGWAYEKRACTFFFVANQATQITVASTRPDFRFVYTLSCILSQLYTSNKRHAFIHKRLQATASRDVFCGSHELQHCLILNVNSARRSPLLCYYSTFSLCNFGSFPVLCTTHRCKWYHLNGHALLFFSLSHNSSLRTLLEPPSLFAILYCVWSEKKFAPVT